MPVFERVREVACSAQDLFAFHAVPAALARLTPPFEKAVVIVPLLALKNGARAELQVSIGPVSTRWSAVHHDVKEGSDGGVAGFVDVMERGPCRDWGHEHCFEPLPSSTTGPRCPLTDRIKWTGPALGAGDSFVGVRLKRLFRHRHDTPQRRGTPCGPRFDDPQGAATAGGDDRQPWSHRRRAAIAVVCHRPRSCSIFAGS